MHCGFCLLEINLRYMYRQKTRNTLELYCVIIVFVMQAASLFAEMSMYKVIFMTRLSTGASTSLK